MTTTAQTDLQLDGPHWAFALDFYQRPTWLTPVSCCRITPAST